MSATRLSCQFYTQAPLTPEWSVLATTFGDGYRQHPALYLKSARQEQPIFNNPLTEWSQTKRAPKHGAFLHQREAKQ